VFFRMLQYEGIDPNRLAYDKPSPKLIGFLKKHYRLKDFIPQNNNYVIFRDFFNKNYQIPSEGYVNFDEVPERVEEQSTVRGQPKFKNPVNPHRNPYEQEEEEEFQETNWNKYSSNQTRHT
jgi:hypothetical protein